MHRSVTFEEQWVRLMTHHTLVTRENIEEEWRSASNTGYGYLVSLFWSMIPSASEDTPDQFVQQLPLWCQRIKDTQIRFHRAYRGLVQGTIESRTAFHAHGKTLKLESQRIGHVVRHHALEYAIWERENHFETRQSLNRIVRVGVSPTGSDRVVFG